MAITVGWWVVTGMFFLGALITISSVGQPRKPLEPGAAAVVVAVDILIIAWLLAIKAYL